MRPCQKSNPINAVLVLLATPIEEPNDTPWVVFIEDVKKKVNLPN